MKNKFVSNFDTFVNENNEDSTPEQEALKFQYMLLSRWQSDCEYFLGYGRGSEHVLPSKSVEKHIANMKELWNSLPEKPEWLSYEDILDYEKKMLNYDENDKTYL